MQHHLRKRSERLIMGKKYFMSHKKKMFDLMLDPWRRPRTAYQVSLLLRKQYSLDKIQRKIVNSRTGNLRFLSQRYPIPSSPTLEANWVYHILNRIHLTPLLLHQWSRLHTQNLPHKFLSTAQPDNCGRCSCSCKLPHQVGRLQTLRIR